MRLKNLKTKYLGKNTFYYKTIDSTQKEIWRRVEKNKIKNGSLVFTDIQTSGIGTHGRTWYTDEEKNIAFSFFIEMNCNIQKLDGLTKKIAEIIIEIFEDKYQIKLEIKEPNDIYYNSKKLGGILTETKIISDEVKYLVIGIGINTNKEKFAEEIKDIATSIKKEFNIKVDTKDFITEFCNRFENEIIERTKK
jgi:BirA family biotin operon repressor/biotin-[acetyl-CoA-carboxylase] ligase